MIGGLSSKYHHALPVINTKQPPHTFLSTCSYHLIEELYDKEHSEMDSSLTKLFLWLVAHLPLLETLPYMPALVALGLANHLQAPVLDPTTVASKKR